MLDDYIQDQKGDDDYIRFLRPVSTGGVKHDLGNKARSYLVGDDIRVWITHAGSAWGGINVQTRKRFQEDDRQLVHLIIRHSKNEFESRIKNSDDLSSAVDSLESYAFADDVLEQFVDEPASGQYHINQELDLLGTFYHDGERLLHRG